MNYQEESNVFVAVGRVTGYLEGGFYYEATWEAPLRITDASFSHAFGTQHAYELEQEVLTLEDLEFRDFFVLNCNEDEVVATPAQAKLIKQQCMKMYDKGVYNIEEV